MPIFCRRAAGALCLAAAAIFDAGAALAQYRLQAGDVIEVAVAGAPEMRQRSSVQIDGSISVPVAGVVMVEGATLPEMRERIQSALGRKMLRARGSDGRETTRSIDPDEIAVSVVEYKPIFLSGEVARPGEQAFRPRMTIRQAIASAGGVSSSTGNGQSPADAATQRSAYVAAWLGAAGEELRIWRIRTELGEKATFDLGAAPQPVPNSVLAEMLELERQTAAKRNAAQERERDYLKRAIKEADQQIAILAEQSVAEDKGAQADAADLQRAMDMYGKGALPSPRVSEYRRAVLLSSTRKLQTMSQLLQVKRTRGEYGRSLDKLDEDRRAQLTVEHREAIVKLALERSRLQSAEERMRASGVALPRPAMDGAGRVEVTVIRAKGKTVDRLIAYEDLELMPGDVVEVSSTGEAVQSVNLSARQGEPTADGSARAP
jgi:polysaccharide export outer membrane protein